MSTIFENYVVDKQPRFDTHLGVREQLSYQNNAKKLKTYMYLIYLKNQYNEYVYQLIHKINFALNRMQG